MPGGDRTGPLGAGPQTGRAAGYCAGHDAPGHISSVPGFGGRGWGHGRARGRRGGWRHDCYATLPPGGRRGRRAYGWRGFWHPGDEVPLSREQELSELKADLSYFEQNVERIRRRIDELAAQEPTEGT